MIEHRRERVSHLRLRGGTIREIAASLVEAGVAASPATVTRDLQVIEQRWRESAVADLAEHKARQLAELSEAKRQAWVDGNLPVYLRALEIEIRLLGTDAPVRVDWRQEAARVGIDASAMMEALIGYVEQQAVASSD